MRFNRVLLEELCELITDGAHASPKAVKKGYKMLSVKDMETFDFNYDSSKQISEEDYLKLVSGNCQPKPNDVLIAKDGNSCLEYCFVFREVKDVVLLSSIAILRPNLQKVNPYYLMYYLSAEKAKKELKEGYLSGSAIPRVVLKDFKKYPLYIPSLQVQDKIVDLIYALNSKIELNSAVIKNLEQLSQTLFKHWFIDFEFSNKEGLSYKSSGGKMVDSELGEIPERWEIGFIDDLGSVIGGGTPPTKEESYYTENGISWITPKDLSNNKSKIVYRGAIDISDIGLANSSAKLMPAGTILFSSRAPIGYIAIAGKEVSTNQGFKSIIPDKGYSSYFIYFVLHQMLPTIESYAGGSTFKEISGQGLKSINIVLPPVYIVEKFTNLVTSLFEQIKSTENENDILVNIRDAILPKLLSGEVEILDESVVD